MSEAVDRQPGDNARTMASRVESTLPIPEVESAMTSTARNEPLGCNTPPKDVTYPKLKTNLSVDIPMDHIIASVVTAVVPEVERKINGLLEGQVGLKIASLEREVTEGQKALAIAMTENLRLQVQLETLKQTSVPTVDLRGVIAAQIQVLHGTSTSTTRSELETAHATNIAEKDQKIAELQSLYDGLKAKVRGNDNQSDEESSVRAKSLGKRHERYQDGDEDYDQDPVNHAFPSAANHVVASSSDTTNSSGGGLPTQTSTTQSLIITRPRLPMPTTRTKSPYARKKAKSQNHPIIPKFTNLIPEAILINPDQYRQEVQEFFSKHIDTTPIDLSVLKDLKYPKEWNKTHKRLLYNMMWQFIQDRSDELVAIKIEGRPHQKNVYDGLEYSKEIVKKWAENIRRGTEITFEVADWSLVDPEHLEIRNCDRERWEAGLR